MLSINTVGRYRYLIIKRTTLSWNEHLSRKSNYCTMTTYVSKFRKWYHTSTRLKSRLKSINNNGYPQKFIKETPEKTRRNIFKLQGSDQH